MALAAAAIILYVRERNEAEPTPAPPPPLAGRNELIHVANALQNEDLEVEILPRGVPAGALSVPGQGMTVDGAPLYAFIYRDAATAEQEAAAVDPAAIAAAATAGTPTAAAPPHVTQHSNVIVALVGGSPEVIEKVDRAITGLP